MKLFSPVHAAAQFWLRTTFILLVAGLALSASLWAAEQLYTCGMHPQIIKKEPGNCPICGMKLTPIRANNVGAASTSGERHIKYYKSTMMPGEVKPGPGKDSMGMDMVPVYEGEDVSGDHRIQIDAATTQRMNLKTALVEHGPVRREIRTVGVVAYNEEGLRDITTKYEGWIEKLYVNKTWTVVKVGDPLFEIYSPDLYNAQLNYAVARRSEGDTAGPLTRAALARLQLFDVPAEVVDELNRSGEPRRTLLFRAPIDGVVIEKMAVAGQMMKPGEQIYRLADLSSVWVQAQVYEKDFPFIREGQTATIVTSYGPDRKFEGTVQLLLPQVEEQTRTATARIALPNPDRFLRPGMFVDVSFTSQLADDAVLVPDIAVLRSGERNTVFVALDGGFFEPREVKLGARSEGNFYEVKSGLNSGDRIVTSGQFMLDSESQLREAIQKMLRNSQGAGTVPATTPAPAPKGHQGHGASAEPSNPPASMDPHAGHATMTAEAAPKLYTCPMEEHADVVSDHPGPCPKCGMTLVPTSSVPHGAKADGAWRRQHGASVEPTAGAGTPAAMQQARAPGDAPVVADLVAYIRSAGGLPQKEGTCGSCGMTDAQMAAGECGEHAR